MSTNNDVDLMSPYGVIGNGDHVVQPDGHVTVVDGLLIARARCCRDWQVLAGVRIGHCGYCGQVPEVLGPW